MDDVNVVAKAILPTAAICIFATGGHMTNDECNFGGHGPPNGPRKLTWQVKHQPDTPAVAVLPFDLLERAHTSGRPFIRWRLIVLGAGHTTVPITRSHNAEQDRNNERQPGIE